MIAETIQWHNDAYDLPKVEGVYLVQIKGHNWPYLGQFLKSGWTLIWAARGDKEFPDVVAWAELPQGIRRQCKECAQGCDDPLRPCDSCGATIGHGAQEYDCDACVSPCCTACSVNGEGNLVVCDKCHKEPKEEGGQEP